MHSYLVTLADRITGAQQRIIVQSDCSHGMQEYIDAQVAEGNAAITLAHPVVIDVDERIARHIPLQYT